MITISLFNRSVVLSDLQAKSVVEALQLQIRHDFAPIWGRDAQIQFFGKNATPPSNSWWVGLFDDAEQASSLFSGSFTDANFPFAKIFVKNDLNSGTSLSVTMSHTIMEMLADPYANLSVADDESRLWGVEVCDPCENDKYAYKVGGFLVSNFVTPAWFQSKVKDARFDFQGKLKHPFELLPGGYATYLELTKIQEGWVQVSVETEDVTVAASTVKGRKPAKTSRTPSLYRSTGRFAARSGRMVPAALAF